METLNDTMQLAGNVGTNLLEDNFHECRRSTEASDLA